MSFRRKEDQLIAFPSSGEGSDETSCVSEMNILIDASMDQEQLASEEGDIVHHIARGVATRIVTGTTHVSLCVVTIVTI
jgi:hypothetical protein